MDFKKHQKLLLFIFNSPLRRFLGVPNSFKGKAVKITPNSIHRVKRVYEDRIEYEMISMVGQPLFAKAIHRYTNIAILASMLIPRIVFPIPRLLPLFALTTGDFPTGAGDGFVGLQGATFSTVRGAATGDTTNYTGTDIRSFCRWNGANYFVYRGFLPADTSSIGASATITAAEMHTFLINAPASSSVVFGMIATSQASSTTLVAADYDNVTLTAKGTFTVASTDGVGTEYTGTLTDLTLINKTGTSLIGIAENAYDIGNSAPATNLEVNLGASENATAGYRPFYRITYTVAATFIPQIIII